MNEEKFKLGGGYISPDEVSLRAYEVHISKYAFASKFTTEKKILDIACGVGYGSAYLVDNGSKMVVAGDISKEAIEYAKAHYYSKQKLNFIRLDCEKLPFSSNTFDVIVSLETLEHLRRPKEFLLECKGVLKKDGIFICSTPNKGAYFCPPKKPLNPTHIKEFTAEELYELMKVFFSEVSLYGQNPITLTQKLLRSGSRLLPYLPRGDKICDFLKPVIYREYRKKISSEMLSEKFRVLPLPEFPYSFQYTIVVAKP